MHYDNDGGRFHRIDDKIEINKTNPDNRRRKSHDNASNSIVRK